MPPVVVLGPVVVPLLAAGVIAAFGLANRSLGPVASIGAWGALAALLVVWLTVRTTEVLTLGALGFGSSLVVRIDAVAFVFGLMVLVPASILLTLQPRAWQDATLATLGVAAAIAALEAGDVVLTAIAGGTAASIAVVLLDIEDPRAPRPRWSLLLAAWLALSWAGVTLQVHGGTADYRAVPVSTLTVPVFALVAVAALTASGLLPWRPWPSQLWSRGSLRAASMTVATLFPLGFYLLVRAYEMGGGRYPHPIFNVLLASIGVVVSFGAAIRAQAAPSRREFLGEVIPGIGGFALMGLALGTSLGLDAALIMLATASALVACLALLPDRASLASLAAIAAAVGLPPGLFFGARVVGIESTFEAGDFLGLIGLGGAVTWAIWIAASARAVGLPAGHGRPATETYPAVAFAIAVVTLVAGPGLAAIQVGLANPVQAEVMQSAPVSLVGRLTSVVTVSTVVPALALFAPLLLMSVAAYAGTGVAAFRSQARPALFTTPFGRAWERTITSVRSATMPEQYRSILNVRELELAASGGNAVLWLVALVALVFAVTR